MPEPSLRDSSGCPVCTNGRPLHVLAEMEAAWLTMPPQAALPGYVCLVAKTHAVEMHDLDDGEAYAFTRDIRRVSKALQRVTGAVKLNYEIHGNTLPHLHMHFYPRTAGDPFEGKPIDPRSATGPTYGPGQFEALRTALVMAMIEDAA